jgi:hypothetical protein
VSPVGDAAITWQQSNGVDWQMYQCQYR